MLYDCILKFVCRHFHKEGIVFIYSRLLIANILKQSTNSSIDFVCNSFQKRKH